MSGFFGGVVGAYDLAGGVMGRPDGNATILRFPTPRAFSLPAALTGSRAVVGVAPSVDSVFSLKKNAVQFGTLTFLAGQVVGVFAAALATAFVGGDVLTVVAPNPQDLLLADLGFSLAGTGS